MKKLSFYFLIFLLFISCNSKNEGETNVKPYFDLEGYFKKEVLRLSKKNPTINKTVFINGKEEQKKINIKNWEQEFKSFIDADINKASWKGSFSTTTAGNLKTYITQSDKIPVKKLEVFLKDEKHMYIRIFITNTNDLYTSQDSLTYFPDSVYQIKKTQHIRLMETKQYEITGRFK